MEYGCRRPIGHARISVGCASTDSFKQTQDGSHTGFIGKRLDEVDFRGSGIDETGVHSPVDKRSR
jgi:hypothetical protein